MRGATLPVMVAGLIAMVAAVGSAIDLARIDITTSQMQAGVDAAALAGANAYDNDDDNDPNGRYQQVIAYFRDNFSDHYMGIGKPVDASPISSTSVLLTPQFEVVNGVSRTVVNAKGRLPMTFMSIFGIQPKTISVTAHAEFQPHPLEVMVVLDNTGSMQDSINGVPKINALKTAMHGFINVLYQGSDSPQPNLALGIINYTNMVNVGSILKAAGIGIQSMPGFTDHDWASGDGMGWKGCVANDETVTSTINTGNLTPEKGAYDLTNVLPGETPTGFDHAMADIRPLLIPPLWKPQSTTKGSPNTFVTPTMNSATGYYAPADNSSYNNLYGGSNTSNITSKSTASAIASASLANQTALSAWVNTPTFKRYFYRYYIGMNNGSANAADDVIVAADKSSYYDPTLSTAYNPLTGTGTDFWIRVDKIPNLAFFHPAGPYVTTSNTTAMPSPNWQCPQPGLPISYNVARSVYDNFVDQQVWAIKPANGTMHHTGFLWGWRILSRYLKFVRTPPAGSAAPVRAIVFMTDGETALSDYTKESSTANGSEDKVYTAYGSINDKTVTTSTDSASAIATAANNRFVKTCAIANSYVFPDSKKGVQTYVVAINDSGLDSTSQARLRNCGKDGYYLSTSPTDLNNAFAQIARTLIDVHLTQ